MSQYQIPQFQPYLDNQEYEAIKSCFDLNWITEGPKSKEFVDKLLKMMGVKYGVLAPNGTLSLYMALKSLGIGKGDEVIVPNFTFIASANAIEMVGAKPVFCDVQESDLHIDLKKAAKLVTKRTKAIMPVHIYGMACDMDAVMLFAKKHKLKVVEDAAQAVGVKWNGKQAGTFGEVGSFSFFADKTLTTGEGGLVVTNDEEIYNKLLFMRNQGRINRGSFIHPEIGYNFRMTDLQTAIGLVQLTKFPEIVKKKKKILDTYKKYLDPSIRIIEPLEGSTHIPFRVCITVPGGSGQLMAYLQDQGIEPRTFFYPLHMQPCYEDTSLLRFLKFQKDLRVSERLYNEGVCLPSWVGITTEQIKFICKSINNFKKW
jgi:perosamine synthetase